SVGAQSFDAATLAFLGRRHTAADTAATVRRLRAAGFSNIGLDLIAAVPEQPRTAFLSSLDCAIALAPQHLSVYALSIEEGTPFHKRGVTLPSDDEQLDQIAAAEERLAREGYRRYEISNYALPGYECRHNLAVWRGEDYTGIGPAAASRIGLTRSVNPWSVVSGQWSALTPEEDEAERFMTGLRLAEGVAIPPTPQGTRWHAALNRLVPLGLATSRHCEGATIPRHCEGAEHPKQPRIRYALTPRGREVADAILRELLP
ncbi:MAG: hypothetical protein FWF84_07345, partial [Kiritimatiellaeota bacterium]|nr:hypothetical protein [Kiritimatiellota bacterium]